MEKIILGRDTYENVKAMLESSDKGNTVMGLTCIENSDFKMNITYILLMLKEANIEVEMWKKHAEKTIKKYTTLGIKRPLTYKKIMETLIRYNVDIEDMQFFMNRFALKMVNDINKNRRDEVIEIKEIKITINPNNYENRTISQGLQRVDAEGTLLRNVPDNAEQEVE